MHERLAFIHSRELHGKGLASSVTGSVRKVTWDRLRVNNSWMAVVFARQVADCFWPTGGTEHNVTDTLSGIHLFKRRYQCMPQQQRGS